MMLGVLVMLGMLPLGSFSIDLVHFQDKTVMRSGRRAELARLSERASV